MFRTAIAVVAAFYFAISINDATGNCPTGGPLARTLKKACNDEAPYHACIKTLLGQ